MNWIEKANERLKRIQKLQEQLAKKGGEEKSVGYDVLGLESQAEGAKPVINVRGRRRGVLLDENNKTLYPPKATVYVGSEGGEKAIPGWFRGLGVIGIAAMKFLGASESLIRSVREAHRQDTRNYKEKMSLPGKNRKKT